MSQPTRTVVVSDAHLGAIPPQNERAFVDLLERVPEIGDELLVNGDLFDFWFEYRTTIPRGHLDVLAALRALVRGGMPVRFLGGNHDGWAGSFLRDDVGLELVEGPVVMPVGGRNAYVAHGDGLGGGDRGYGVLKRVIRSRLATFGFRAIHPDLGIPMAGLASSTEAHAARGPGYVSPRAATLAAHAAAILQERPEIDLVVFGHAHAPHLEEIEPGRFYLNAGDWIHNRSYAVVSAEEIRLVTAA